MAETHGFSMGTVAGTAIPVEHLDYGYIKKCKNAKELEKIVQVLRSGKEGYYPQLMEYAEKRLKELDPDSKTLLRDVPARRSTELGSVERQRVEHDLEGWLTEMGGGGGPVPGKGVLGRVDTPPVRASGVKISSTQGKSSDQRHDAPDQKSHPGRIKSWDFNTWDKYDVDKAVEEVDQGNIVANASPPGCQDGQHNPPEGFDLSERELNLSQNEKEHLAERERVKGNEEFRSGGFEEALSHYKRSVTLYPTPAALNNRALTYLKLSCYQEAIEDCEQVLAAEPANPKALYRKATACDHLGDLTVAKECLERALQVDDKNQKALNLLKSVEKKLLSKAETAGGDPSKRTKGPGKKIQIVEVLEGPANNVVQSPTSRDADEREGCMKEGGTREQLSAPPDVAASGDKVQTHWQLGDMQQSSDSDKVHSSDSDKLCSGDSDKMPSADSDKLPSTDSDKLPCADGDKLPSADGDKLPSANGDKLPSADGDKLPSTDGVKLPFADSDKLPSADGDKLSSADSDKPPSADGDKLPSADGDRQQRSYAEMQHSPAPDVSVLPNHLPSEVHALKREGNDLFQKGQYTDALDKYSQALQSLEKASPPDRVGGRCMLLNNRAACWLKLGDCNQCVQDCTCSIKLYPVNIKAFARRAQAHELKESFGLAYADYKCAVLLDSLFEQGRKAMARLSQFLRKQHGQLWMEQLPLGDTETVLCALSGSARDNAPVGGPVSFDMLREEGNSLVRSGQFSEAMESYSRCIALCPENAVSYTNRALCFLKLNQPSLAEQDCSTALLLEPANIKALYRRGLARKELNKFSEAARDLSDLLKRDQSNIVATKELESVKALWRKELKDLQSDVGSTGRTAQPPAGSGKRKKKIVVEETSEENEVDNPAASVPAAPVPAAPVPAAPVPAAPVPAASVPSAFVPAASVPVHSPSTQHEPEGPQGLLERQVDLGEAGYQLSAPIGEVSPFEFLQKWNSVPARADNAAHCYALLLSQVDPPELPRIISKSLDGAMLSGILKALHQQSLRQDMPRVAQLLKSLTTVDRFSTIVLFLSKQEKIDVRELFHEMGECFSVLPTPVTVNIRKLEEQFGLL